MENLSLANKYRPQRFEDVLGQDATVKALVGKIKEGRLPRTSLYCGSHGSGKTTLARIVAKAVNCQNPVDGNPCCKCESCVSIDAGVSTDVIEMDAASHNKVEDAEKIVKQTSFMPSGNKKVIILDEFHMMTKEAQNKLLKVVEEPPAHVMFIFCTTEENRILPTILSRCNKFSFKAISDMDILSNLKKIAQKEGFEYEEDALKLITKSANGHVRDSLSVLEQLSYDKLTVERVSDVLGLTSDEQIFLLLQAVLLRDTKSVLEALEEVFLLGNIQNFLKRVVYILCYMLTFSDDVEDAETADFRNQCSMLRDSLLPELSIRFIQIITETLRDNRGLGLELATRLCFLSMIMEEEKTDRITLLEEQVVSLQKKLDEMGSIPVSVATTAAVTTPQMMETITSDEHHADASRFTETFESAGLPFPEVSASEDGFAPIEEDGFVPIGTEDMPWVEQIPFEEPFTSVSQQSEPQLQAEEAPVAKPSPVLSIPGGNVHPKEEPIAVTKPIDKPAEVQTPVENNVETEAPELGGFFDDAGFGESFSGGLFGSTGASFF